ncbi:conserved Plasmodium protein, unknown function [Plasmodium ovale wallikeri]|uniref:CHY-type domain-containing protein n=1 Tax=Plasmodium ovale wallikeri TaxID=864142 RepID=A0A1A8YQA9_PLAOA|nr:conserved Plasmodium protein, unknown function [Plasmodium ovale wallikeri]
MCKEGNATGEAEGKGAGGRAEDEDASSTNRKHAICQKKAEQRKTSSYKGKHLCKENFCEEDGIRNNSTTIKYNEKEKNYSIRRGQKNFCGKAYNNNEAGITHTCNEENVMNSDMPEEGNDRMRKENNLGYRNNLRKNENAHNKNVNSQKNMHSSGTNAPNFHIEKGDRILHSYRNSVHRMRGTSNYGSRKFPEDVNTARNYNFLPSKQNHRINNFQSGYSAQSVHFNNRSNPSDKYTEEGNEKRKDNSKYGGRYNPQDSTRGIDHFNKGNYNRPFYNSNLNKNYFNYNIKVNTNIKNYIPVQYRKKTFNMTYSDDKKEGESFKKREDYCTNNIYTHDVINNTRKDIPLSYTRNEKTEKHSFVENCERYSNKDKIICHTKLYDDSYVQYRNQFIPNEKKNKMQNDYVDMKNGENDDSINVGENDDSINVGENDDSINVGENDDSINVGENDDSINVGENGDSINVGENDDSINEGEKELVHTNKGSNDTSVTNKNITNNNKKTEVHEKMEKEKKMEDESKHSIEETNEKLKKEKREEEKKKVLNWKNEEQTLLEEGLRVYKNLKNSPQKWEKISQLVKTKNADDCLKRFLYCRFVVLKEKKKLERGREQQEEKAKEVEKEKQRERTVERAGETGDQCPKNGEKGQEQQQQGQEQEQEQDIDSDDMSINNNINIKGKSLLLSNVRMKNISLYKSVLLKLQLICTRCCNTFDITSTSKDPPQLVCNCTNCSSSAVIEIYRNICFLENSCICILKFNQCSLMDLLTADYSINCESCGRKSILKNVTSGKEINVNCQKCFTKLEFRYTDFTFDETTSANNATIKKIDEMINKLFTKKKTSKKIGVPTSNNLKIEKSKNVVKINNIEVKDGACKHFKRSHRLFKFPCCNKIFPCPTCHDMNSNHECTIARRVICGFCYREFDDDDVCICQRDKKTKKGGNFWEGCRNAITLSKNDSKKYKLLNRQTVQKKKKAK